MPIRPRSGIAQLGAPRASPLHDTRPPAKPDTPLLVIRSYFDRVINQRDLSACTERLAPSYIDHDAPASLPPGPGSTIAYYERYFAEHPLLSVQIEDLLVDGRKASLRLTYEGRDQTDTSFSKTGIVIIHLDDNDRFVERWSCYE